MAISQTITPFILIVGTFLIYLMWDDLRRQNAEKKDFVTIVCIMVILLFMLISSGMIINGEFIVNTGKGDLYSVPFLIVAVLLNVATIIISFYVVWVYAISPLFRLTKQITSRRGYKRRW